MPRPQGPIKKTAPAAKPKGRAKAKPEVANYDHTEPKALVRPEIGTQAHFKQKKGPAKYRYDDSLAPDLNWAEEYLPREQARACVLHGGEEHSLLATFPERASLPAYWRVLGRVAAVPAGEEPGVWLDARPLPERGWDHFRGA